MVIEVANIPSSQIMFLMVFPSLVPRTWAKSIWTLTLSGL